MLLVVLGMAYGRCPVRAKSSTIFIVIWKRGQGSAEIMEIFDVLLVG